MIKFESVIIVKPDLEEEKLKDLINKIESLIKENGNLEKTDDLGKKKLAYEVKGNKEGNYFVFYFEAEFGFTPKLEKLYREIDGILKFITIRMEE